MIENSLKFQLIGQIMITEKYKYYYISLSDQIQNIDYYYHKRDFVDNSTNKIETVTNLEFPEYHKNKHWIRSTLSNSFVDSKGIYKNRFQYLTDYRLKPDLSTNNNKFSGMYLIDRIYQLSVALDSYNIPFNLIQVEEINKSNYVTVLNTYILLDNKKDLAKIKLKF